MVVCRRRVAAAEARAPPRGTPRHQMPQRGQQLRGRTGMCPQPTSRQPAQPQMVPSQLRPLRTRRTGAQMTAMAASSLQSQPRQQHPQHQTQPLRRPPATARRRMACSRWMASGRCHERGPRPTQQTRWQACRRWAGSGVLRPSLPRRPVEQVRIAHPAIMAVCHLPVPDVTLHRRQPLPAVTPAAQVARRITLQGGPWMQACQGSTAPAGPLPPTLVSGARATASPQRALRSTGRTDTLLCANQSPLR